MSKMYKKICPIFLDEIVSYLRILANDKAYLAEDLNRCSGFPHGSTCSESLMRQPAPAMEETQYRYCIGVALLRLALRNHGSFDKHNKICVKNILTRKIVFNTYFR